METLRESENASTVKGEDDRPSLKDVEVQPDIPVGEGKEDVIPDGGYGWVNVGCIVAQNSVTWGKYPCLGILHSQSLPYTPHKSHVDLVIFRSSVTCHTELTGRIGVNTTYGVYSAYYLQNSHFIGGSTFGYAWVGGLCVAIALLIAPGVNWMVGKFGFRVPLVIGTSDPLSFISHRTVV